MSPRILISYLFENKIYLLPVRCRVINLDKVGLIMRDSARVGLLPKVKGHKGRGVCGVGCRLGLLLNQIVSAAIT